MRALREFGERPYVNHVGVFEMKISDEDREQWRPEQLEVLRHIGDLAHRSSEPVVLLHIKKILWWHRSYSDSEAVRVKADAIVSTMPESFELNLTEELMDPYHSRDLLPEEREGDYGYKRQQERIEQKQRALVDKIISHSGGACMAYSLLTDRIQTLTDAGIRPEPQVLLAILAGSEPDLAAGISDIIVDDPNGALAPYLHPLLSNVRVWNAERAREIDQRALKENSNILHRGVALSYQARGWADKATAQDIENIGALLKHGDLDVRLLAIGSLGVLAESHQRVAIDLAIGVELSSSNVLARELCRLFFGGWGIPFSNLTADDLSALLSKLEEIPDIMDYPINTFLINASERDPKAVVGLLLRRIKRSENENREYRALPLLGFDRQLTGLATGPHQESLLRAIRDSSLESGRAVEHWIPKLFREVSSGLETTASLKVLAEWINSGDPARIESAARLASGAPPGFVFKHVDFVTNLLERAQGANADCYRKVAVRLMGCAISGTRSGTVGQPMPQDVAIRDQASLVADGFDIGSPSHRFYAQLAKHAEESIKDDMLRDEELFE